MARRYAAAMLSSRDDVCASAQIARSIGWVARTQSKEAVRTGKTAPKADANEQLGNRVLSTLIGGLVGGALIGWVLDKLFHTGHVLLIVFLVLGTVGGFWSIIKLSSRRS